MSKLDFATYVDNEYKGKLIEVERDYSVQGQADLMALSELLQIQRKWLKRFGYFKYAFKFFLTKIGVIKFQETELTIISEPTATNPPPTDAPAA